MSEQQRPHADGPEGQSGARLAVELEALREPGTLGNLLNSGVQYRVYEMPNGRIRKVPTTVEEATEKLVSWEDSDTVDMDAMRRQAEGHVEATQYNEQYIQALLEAHPDISSYLSNPQFLPGGGYEQDRARPLAEVLATASPEEARAIFEEYARGKFLEWRHGFSEVAYNLTVNSGINDEGEVVLFDFGELTTNPDAVLGDIGRKRWLNQYSYTQGLREELKDIYASVMGEYLTPESFAEHWQGDRS